MRTPGRPRPVTIALSALVAGVIGLGLATPAYAGGPPTSTPAKSKGGSAKSCSGFSKFFHLC
jgi:hypothetical protein